MASVGEVLAALGGGAGAIDRAARHIADAHTEFGGAAALLGDVLAASGDQQAADATAGMTGATDSTADAAILLSRAADQLATVVERLRTADGTAVPPGARAACAPVPGRTHPTHTPVPPAHARDHEWAGQVGAQLTQWQRGKPTEALVFDAAGNDWQVNSGVDAALTAAASAVIEEMISAGAVGTSADTAANHAERTWLRRAKTHAETKAAVWAAANGKKFVDVVTNRNMVCGEEYEPGNRYRPPGCAQAVEAILPAGYTMRVWRQGMAEPLIITGRGRKGGRTEDGYSGTGMGRAGVRPPW
jgi:SCP1.201-like deaminase